MKMVRRLVTAVVLEGEPGWVPPPARRARRPVSAHVASGACCTRCTTTCTARTWCVGERGVSAADAAGLQLAMAASRRLNDWEDAVAHVTHVNDGALASPPARPPVVPATTPKHARCSIQHCWRSSARPARSSPTTSSPSVRRARVRVQALSGHSRCRRVPKEAVQRAGREGRGEACGRNGGARAHRLRARRQAAHPHARRLAHADAGGSRCCRRCQCPEPAPAQMATRQASELGPSAGGKPAKPAGAK
jgi:hypothetical protein